MTGARLALVGFLTIVIQVVVVSRIEAFGARGDIVVLFAIAVAYETDADRGAVAGFGAGLVFDLLLSTPVGLSALTYCLVGWVVGTFKDAVLRTSWWIPVMGAAVASAGGTAFYAAVARLFGVATVYPGELPGILLVVAASNALLSRPMRGAVRLAVGDQRRDRVRLR